MADTPYVTLMSSLPYHGRLFGARQTPLSRFQLNKRLQWLQTDDKDTLTRIEDVLRWRRLLLSDTDTDFLDRANRVIESLSNPLLSEVVATRLEARTLIAALRMRIADLPPPGPRQRWGFGRWVSVIVNHWTDADFGLQRQYPWVIEADHKLREGDAVSVERLFLDHSWTQLARLGAGHYFDFEAVVIYVLRWDLIDRWTRYQDDAARLRILDLADSGMGEYGKMFH